MSEDLTTVRRHIRISILQDPECLQHAAGIIKALPGVLETTAKSSSKWICVRYDATKLQYPALIKALEEQGLITKLSWWERVKRSWYSDQDCIARDNARAKPSPCCSNPTSIMAQSGKKKHHP